MKKLHDEHIVKLELGSSNSSIDPRTASALENGAIQLFKEEIIPQLKANALKDGKYLYLDCTQPGNYLDPSDFKNAARMALAKRLIALKLLKHPLNSVFGPYFGPHGEVGVTRDPSFQPPMLQENRSALIAMVYQNAQNGTLGTPWPMAFYDSSAKLASDKFTDTFVRFMINDDFYKDNGYGSCKLTVMVEEKSNLLFVLLGLSS